MTNVWVILNESRDAVVEVFETKEADSLPHWPKFFGHKPGCVFCGRTETVLRFNKPNINRLKWYSNYFYWEDTSRWGYGDPNGIGWTAIMALPEPLKMIEFVGAV